MAVNKLQLKRSAVAGKHPTTSSLDLGELAINTIDGKVFFKKDDGVQTIVQLADVSGSILSASYSQTSSHSDKFTVTGPVDVYGSQYISGSLVVGNDITARRLVVQTITSSVIYSSGSNIFGDELSDTQQFTGSVTITGSLTVNGRNYITDSGSFDKRINYISSSFEAATASLNLFSASMLSTTASLNAFSSSVLNFTASTIDNSNSFNTSNKYVST